MESSLEEHGSDYTDIDGEYPKLRIPFAPPARRGEKYSKRTRMQRQQDAAQKQPGPRRELGSPVNMTKGKNAKKGSSGGAQPMKAGLKRDLSSITSNEEKKKKKRSLASMNGTAKPKKSKPNESAKKRKT